MAIKKRSTTMASWKNAEKAARKEQAEGETEMKK